MSAIVIISDLRWCGVNHRCNGKSPEVMFVLDVFDGPQQRENNLAPLL
jgi:hypothetical protein